MHNTVYVLNATVFIVHFKKLNFILQEFDLNLKKEKKNAEIEDKGRAP